MRYANVLSCQRSSIHGVARHIQIILLLLLLGTFSACSGSAPPQIEQDELTPAALNWHPTEAPLVPMLAIPTPFPKPIPAADWRDRWLQGDPCRAPCWEGITPGQTKAVDAVRLLHRSSIVTDVEQCGYPADMDECVSWSWIDRTKSGGGTVWFPHQADPLINTTFLQFAEHSFNLGEIMAAYGPPSHVIPTKTNWGMDGMSGTSYGLLVVYLPQGFYMEAVTDLSSTITSNLDVGGEVTLFAPSFEGFDAALQNRYNHTDLISWQGFQDFTTYCQQAETSSHKVCQVENRQ